jgi:hypothetical protein
MNDCRLLLLLLSASVSSPVIFSGLKKTEYRRVQSHTAENNRKANRVHPEYNIFVAGYTDHSRYYRSNYRRPIDGDNKR